ncbi:glycosyltransferase family 4 protein [Cellulosimicrobium arenosum]|uniref:D-inositol 3-phosphate glycosyltransferase n=1 Tax=Cellulosimicrobium arenosum TaxID=2708133 RepID=A0A927G8Q9_9MICO|nr:glycosyltransferase family 4 protein [Cellulosimicrobium arenosum]MBD8078946.1 glycosyltransferase family 4 protein [Cellulosimicrobium arenosum]
MSTPSRVALVNNSRETFTPTVSGAIATCLWELLRTEQGSLRVDRVVTRPAAAPTYPTPVVEVVRPHPHPFADRRAGRALRRLSGWAHADQASYARLVGATLRRSPADTAVCSNDPEVAVHLARVLTDTQVVHWFHNLEVAGDRWRRAYAALHGSRVRTVAVSAYLARAVEQVYRLSPGSVGVARNGVDAGRFTPGAAPGLDDEERALTVAHLGRVAVEKGLDVFLDAAEVLQRRGVELTVLVIGDTNWGFSDGGPFGTAVAERVAALRAGGVDVRTTGHVARADLPDVLRRADVQVLASRWDEPCALTVLEGMATGLPFVASATGGTPELVGDAGLLVPRESPVALADALERLLRDRPARDRLGGAARARAEEFTWDRTWSALVDGLPSAPDPEVAV